MNYNHKYIKLKSPIVTDMIKNGFSMGKRRGSYLALTIKIYIGSNA